MVTVLWVGGINTKDRYTGDKTVNFPGQLHELGILSNMADHLVTIRHGVVPSYLPYYVLYATEKSGSRMIV